MTSYRRPMDVMWSSCRRRPVDVLWTSYGHRLDVLWTSYGRHIDLKWSWCRRHMDVVLTSCGRPVLLIERPVDVVWTSYERPQVTAHTETHKTKSIHKQSFKMNKMKVDETQTKSEQNENQTIENSKILKNITTSGHRLKAETEGVLTTPRSFQKLHTISV